MQVAFFLAVDITQVKESIPGVRCASGNVLRKKRLTILTNYLMLGSLHLLLLLHHPGSLLLDPPPPLLLLLNLLPPLLILLITINIKRVMVVEKVSFTMTKRITVPR